MLPRNMNLNIRSGTVGHNNKILVSDEKFSLGKNDEVNTPAMKSHAQTADSNELQAHAPTITHKNQAPQIVTHNEEKIALVLFLAGCFAIWNMFRWLFGKRRPKTQKAKTPYQKLENEDPET